MAVNRKVCSVTFPASGDLSHGQFRAVVINSSGQVALAAGGGTPLVGVLMNKPAATGRAAEVAIPGSEVKIEAGTAIVPGEMLVSNANGQVLPKGSGTAFILGIATQAASGSGAIAGVLVNPGWVIT